MSMDQSALIMSACEASLFYFSAALLIEQPLGGLMSPFKTLASSRILHTLPTRSEENLLILSHEGTVPLDYIVMLPKKSASTRKPLVNLAPQTRSM